jgi:hypothetical protein
VATWSTIDAPRYGLKWVIGRAHRAIEANSLYRQTGRSSYVDTRVIPPRTTLTLVKESGACVIDPDGNPIQIVQDL